MDGPPVILCDEPTSGLDATSSLAIVSKLKQMAGMGHTVALTRTGACFSWGWNRDGQLGVGDTAGRAAPCRLGGLPPMQHVACGGG